MGKKMKILANIDIYNPGYSNFVFRTKNVSITKEYGRLDHNYIYIHDNLNLKAIVIQDDHNLFNKKFNQTMREVNSTIKREYGDIKKREIDFENDSINYTVKNRFQGTSPEWRSFYNIGEVRIDPKNQQVNVPVKPVMKNLYKKLKIY